MRSVRRRPARRSRAECRGQAEERVRGPMEVGLFVWIAAGGRAPAKLGDQPLRAGLPFFARRRGVAVCLCGFVLHVCPPEVGVSAENIWRFSLAPAAKF